MWNFTHAKHTSVYARCNIFHMVKWTTFAKFCKGRVNKMNIDVHVYKLAKGTTLYYCSIQLFLLQWWRCSDSQYLLMLRKNLKCGGWQTNVEYQFKFSWAKTTSIFVKFKNLSIRLSSILKCLVEITR